VEVAGAGPEFAQFRFAHGGSMPLAAARLDAASGEMPSSREIARVAARAPKCGVISRCIRRMDSLLVGIPHSIDCDRAVDARLDADPRDVTTCRSPNPLAGTASSDPT
jgi:hypothetical protein